MRSVARAFLLAAPVLISGPAIAGADDAKWVAQCIMDNQGEKASIEVITKYCTCMNDKMDNNETCSISQWEKTHQTEMRACERASGWR